MTNRENGDGTTAAIIEPTTTRRIEAPQGRAAPSQGPVKNPPAGPKASKPQIAAASKKQSSQPETTRGDRPECQTPSTYKYTANGVTIRGICVVCIIEVDPLGLIPPKNPPMWNST